MSGRAIRELLALALVVLAIISVIALFAPESGAVVRPWRDALSQLLGWGIAFAPALLAGFALMLWMKSMPTERWMAASGAAVVALVAARHVPPGQSAAGRRRSSRARVGE